MTTVVIGERHFEVGSKYLTELRESNDIFDDTNALISRLQEDGYLFLRDFHDRTDVLKARTEILLELQKKGRLDPDAPLEEAVIGEQNKGLFLDSNHYKMPRLLDVVNAPRVMGFFDRILGGESMTYDYKWGRAVTRGGFSGAHYDIVYMGRGTKNVYTMWTPLCDISYQMGGLCVCLGSNRFEEMKRTYGQIDVERDKVDGWYTSDPLEIIEKFGGEWASTEFRAGDAVIFGMFMLHGSLTNTTNQYRVSVDTRYQLRSEPVDPRWVGKNPVGSDYT